MDDRGKLRVVFYDFEEEYRCGCIGAHFYEDEESGVSGIAVDPGSPPAVQEGYKIEAEGYFRGRLPKDRRRTMFHASEVEDLDPNALLAIRSVVEDFAPDWVEEIKAAARFSNSPRVIAGYCEISLPVVVAVLQMLAARGDLPDFDEEMAI